ncbi:MAG: hypothetical protein AB7P20_25155 [Rhizobiaceae bacterium]
MRALAKRTMIWRAEEIGPGPAALPTQAIAGRLVVVRVDRGDSDCWRYRLDGWLHAYCCIALKATSLRLSAASPSVNRATPWSTGNAEVWRSCDHFARSRSLSSRLKLTTKSLIIANIATIISNEGLEEKVTSP